MAPKSEYVRSELQSSIEQALNVGNAYTLEQYLCAGSNLPGPRMNTALVDAFAELAAETLVQGSEDATKLAGWLTKWAALPLADAPVNDAREILPASAVMVYGVRAVLDAQYWPTANIQLRKAATSPRWRTRELVASALQRMLKADWARTLAELSRWLTDTHPLVIRAAAAAVAEPPLLKQAGRGTDALAIQARVLDWFASVPQDQRGEEGVRVLRQALGHTVSVAVAAAPDPGFALLEQRARSPDNDLRWIVRETLKKNRLIPWKDRVEAVYVQMGQ